MGIYIDHTNTFTLFLKRFLRLTAAYVYAYIISDVQSNSYHDLCTLLSSDQVWQLHTLGSVFFVIKLIMLHLQISFTHQINGNDNKVGVGKR